MNLDLNSLLDDWSHEPGQIKVRKILGKDGAWKIQLRIDLGLIQMEMDGRPDGLRPHDCESLLEWQKKCAEEAEENGTPFFLSPEECAQLQHEGVQYYHRYLSLFQLNEYGAVIRDTTRNLEMIDFVEEYAEESDSSWAFLQFRPYVLMMQTRAVASIFLTKLDFPGAIKAIEDGCEKIEDFLVTLDNPELVENSSELSFLREWAKEIQSNQPLGPLEKMHLEMKQAIEREEYERAATLRDEIRQFEQSTK